MYHNSSVKPAPIKAFEMDAPSILSDQPNLDCKNSSGRKLQLKAGLGKTSDAHRGLDLAARWHSELQPGSGKRLALGSRLPHSIVLLLKKLWYL